LIETLQKISEGGLKELVAAEIRKQYHGVSIQTIADTLNVAPKDIHSATDQDLPSDILRLESAENYFFITRSEYKKIAHHIPKQLSSYHRRNPLVETGRTIEELLGMLGIPPVSEAQHIVGIVLNELEQKRVLKRVSHTWALSSHDVTDSADSKSKIATIESRLKNNEMKTPLWAELLSFAEQQGIDERMLKQIVRYLVEHKKAYAIEGNYLHASIVDSCRTKLLQALKDTPEGITVAGFRDLVHGNRKICLLLLAIYEKEDIVERQENVRVLTKKGKVMATE